MQKPIPKLYFHDFFFTLMMVVTSGEQDNSVTSSGNSRFFGEHYLAHRIQKPIPKLYFHDFLNPNDGCWIGCRIQ